MKSYGGTILFQNLLTFISYTTIHGFPGTCPENPRDPYLPTLMSHGLSSLPEGDKGRLSVPILIESARLPPPPRGPPPPLCPPFFGGSF